MSLDLLRPCKGNNVSLTMACTTSVILLLPLLFCSALLEQGLRVKALIGHLIPSWSPEEDFISQWYNLKSQHLKGACLPQKYYTVGRNVNCQTRPIVKFE